jgi:hypothetical protein
MGVTVPQTQPAPQPGDQRWMAVTRRNKYVVWAATYQDVFDLVSSHVPGDGGGPETPVNILLVSRDVDDHSLPVDPL